MQLGDDGRIPNDMPLFPLFDYLPADAFLPTAIVFEDWQKIKEVRLTACDIAVCSVYKLYLPAMATAKGRCCGAFNIQMVSVCSGLYFGANGES